jgi:2-phospho-L-lactate/phosphoenolpyruvate guanylyltransferase
VHRGRSYTATMGSGTAVLLPVKAFRESKLRLAVALEASQRVRLARFMAAPVVASAYDLPVWVVCDDDGVAAWAASLSAEVIWSPAKGLNAAVTDGVRVLAEHEVDRVIVAHADLPLATDLRPVADFPGVTLVPDRREDGTNVISLPTHTGFKFHYGPSSFRRHREEARRRGLPVRVLHDPTLSFDLDTPSDLEHLQHSPDVPPALLTTATPRPA